MDTQPVSHSSSLSVGVGATTRLYGSSKRLYQAGWWFIILLTCLQIFVSLEPLYRLVMTSYTPSPDIIYPDLWLTPDLVALFYVIRRLVVFGIFLVTATLIFRWRPDNRLALVTSAGMVAASLNVLTLASEVEAIARQPAFTVIDYGRWLIAYCGVVFMVAAFFILPDGRFIPRWTRPLLTAWALLAAGMMLLLPREQVLPMMNFAILPFISPGIYAQIYRYRRLPPGIERQQLKWIMTGTLLAATVYISYVVLIRLYFPQVQQPGLAQFVYQFVGTTIYHLAVTCVPVTLTIALLRYRLWEVNIIIGRSLVYGSLTVVLAVAFLGMTPLIERLLQWLTGAQQPPTLAVVISTVAVFSVFQPVRQRLQRLVDHRFPGLALQANLRTPDRTLPLPDVDEEGLQPNPTIGGYQLRGLIGRGGMADVYRAWHPTLRREVAIKTLRDSDLSEADWLPRFEREARTIAALRHPNIIQVFDYGIEQATPYLVMEYIDGPDLAVLLRNRGQLSITEALPLIRDLAGALDHAHQRGLIHRDVKPSNVLLRPCPDQTSGSLPRHQAVLTDFGVVKLTNSQTKLTATGLVGTLDYLAPEQITTPDVIDHRADVYGFGILIYQLLTGRVPFHSDNYGALIFMHIQDTPPDPRQFAPGLPEALVEVILRALAKRPDQRYSSAGALASALMNALPIPQPD